MGYCRCAGEQVGDLELFLKLPISIGICGLDVEQVGEMMLGWNWPHSACVNRDHMRVDAVVDLSFV